MAFPAASFLNWASIFSLRMAPIRLQATPYPLLSPTCSAHFMCRTWYSNPLSGSPVLWYSVPMFPMIRLIEIMFPVSSASFRAFLFSSRACSYSCSWK